MSAYEKLDGLKDELDQHRPLGRDVLENLHEDLVLRWTYNSNAIEGNTLTLMETKVALEGITIGGKTMREHFEAINHRDAIFYVEELVQKNIALSEREIKAIHQLVLKNIDRKNAGAYRSINVIVAGASHAPPDSLHLIEEMQQFINWYEHEAQEMHPVERAARVHADFVKIHPFVDGNGRTSRLLMNFELMKAGFPPLVIPVEQRLDYYVALDKAHTTEDYSDFIALIVKLAKQAFDPYWYALGINQTSR